VGGTSGQGTVFKVNTDGTGFSKLYDGTGFSRGRVSRLLLWGKSLYGTTSGTTPYCPTCYPWPNNGTVFALNTDGTAFTTIYAFSPVYYSDYLDYDTNSDGANPIGELISSGKTLYGTASRGGSLGGGTLFSISSTPQLTIAPSAANLVLTWPTKYVGFDYTGYALQSTTHLGSSAVWTTTSAAPVVVNGQNTVTNPISGNQRFYRLSQ